MEFVALYQKRFCKFLRWIRAFLVCLIILPIQQAIGDLL
jgi:hypothetical protein